MAKCSWTTYTGAKKSELTEQIRVMTWCRAMEPYNSEYSLVYHIPNEGKRKQKTGSNLVKAGLKKGVPDICIPISRFNYNSLYIELKKDKESSISKEQIEWIRNLIIHNNAALVCTGADEAINVIKAYMENEYAIFMNYFNNSLRKINGVNF